MNLDKEDNLVNFVSNGLIHSVFYTFNGKMYGINANTNKLWLYSANQWAFRYIAKKCFFSMYASNEYCIDLAKNIIAQNTLVIDNSNSALDLYVFDSTHWLVIQETDNALYEAKRSESFKTLIFYFFYFHIWEFLNLTSYTQVDSYVEKHFEGY